MQIKVHSCQFDPLMLDAHSKLYLRLQTIMWSRRRLIEAVWLTQKVEMKLGTSNIIQIQNKDKSLKT